MEKKHTEINIKPHFVIARLEDDLLVLDDNGTHMDCCSWGSEEGVLLTGNEAKALLGSHYSLIEALKHAVDLIEESRGETHDTKIYKGILKNCEGKTL